MVMESQNIEIPQQEARMFAIVTIGHTSQDIKILNYYNYAD